MSGLTGIHNSRPDLFGAELAAFMKRAVRGFTRYTAACEEQPKIENRVELVSQKDEFGMPLAKITHNYDDNEMALWTANLDEGMKIGRATDAKEVWQVRTAMPAIHLMGGTIMGTGADNSVVNSFGQTHTRCRTSTSPAPASSRPPALRIRPTRCSRCRCARGGESCFELVARSRGEGRNSRKIFAVDRLERRGLLELLQRARERIDECGRNA